MKLGIMVLNKVELLDKLLSELGDAGIGGATILSSTGMAVSWPTATRTCPFWALCGLCWTPTGRRIRPSSWCSGRNRWRRCGQSANRCWETFPSRTLPFSLRCL